LQARKEKTLALGLYPERSLAEARDQRDEARKLVRNDIDPGEERKREKRDQKVRSVNTFRLLANEWHQAQLAKWTARHAASIARRLKVDLFPSLGDRSIAEIEAPELLETLRIIEKRGSHDIAHRVLQIAGQVFRYAIVLGRAVSDPSRDLKGALVVAGRVRHHAALREDELPEFIEKFDKFDGHLQTQLAMKLLLLTFVRTGELRGAKWIEFDFDKALWRIPATRMKTGCEHIVPLSKQALEVLRELQKLHGHRLILFPNQAKPTLPMSENTILFALYRMGFGVCDRSAISARRCAAPRVPGAGWIGCDSGNHRGRSSAAPQGGTKAAPSPPAPPAQSQAHADPVHRQRRQSPVPGCPRRHSRQDSRAVTSPESGLRLRRNASCCRSEETSCFSPGNISAKTTFAFPHRLDPQRTYATDRYPASQCSLRMEPCGFSTARPSIFPGTASWRSTLPH
jgi:integrase